MPRANFKSADIALPIFHRITGSTTFKWSNILPREFREATGLGVDLGDTNAGIAFGLGASGIAGQAQSNSKNTSTRTLASGAC